ncbi:MAG: glycosyltransferase family 2 protein [Bacteroidetes bacterium]|nr:glycosyltransferase family 2 protein [Bacteroidota bacterium]
MDVLVSVLMTAYNREKYIAEAIESVLASTYKNFELIIADDASTDATVSIATQYAAKDTRVKVFVNEKNLGDYPNRNIAASHASGKYLKYVDSDDKILPHSLEIMLAAMEKYPTAAIGFCDKEGNSAAYPVFYKGKEALEKHFFAGGFLEAGPSTSIILKSAFDAMGGFSGKRYVSDYEAWLYLCTTHDVVLLPANLVWVRTHRGQENDVGKLAYYHLNYLLHKNFLQNSHCPLSPKQKSTLLYNYKILLARRMYQRILKWYGVKAVFDTVHKAGESPLILLKAFLPMKKLMHV